MAWMREAGRHGYTSAPSGALTNTTASGRLAEAERGFVASIAGWQAVGLLALAAWGGYELGQV